MDRSIVFWGDVSAEAFVLCDSTCVSRSKAVARDKLYSVHIVHVNVFEIDRIDVDAEVVVVYRREKCLRTDN